MKLTVEVINDLIILRDSGDASADTLALIKAYEEQHPEYVSQIKQQPGEITAMLNDTLASSSVAPPIDHDKKTLLKARKLIQKRSYLLVMAVWFTATPLTISVQNLAEHGFAVQNILGSNPMMTGLFWYLAAIGWVVFLMSNHYLKKSGI